MNFLGGRKKNQTGFTLVELIIVMAVIGILAAFVLNTLASVQSRARDVERITDLRAVHKRLEVYFNDNANYPDLGTLTTSLFPGLHLETLTDPYGNEIDSSGGDYDYTSSNCTGGSCPDYTLTAQMEDQAVYVINSINN